MAIGSDAGSDDSEPASHRLDEGEDSGVEEEAADVNNIVVAHKLRRGLGRDKFGTAARRW
eukprot:SAG11_NODE_14458_length_611_cov_1.068359_3_plen_59_part_01